MGRFRFCPIIPSTPNSHPIIQRRRSTALIAVNVPSGWAVIDSHEWKPIMSATKIDRTRRYPFASLSSIDTQARKTPAIHQPYFMDLWAGFGAVVAATQSIFAKQYEVAERRIELGKDHMRRLSTLKNPKELLQWQVNLGRSMLATGIAEIHELADITISATRTVATVLPSLKEDFDSAPFGTENSTAPRTPLSEAGRGEIKP